MSDSINCNQNDQTKIQEYDKEKKELYEVLLHISKNQKKRIMISKN